LNGQVIRDVQISNTGTMGYDSSKSKNKMNVKYLTKDDIQWLYKIPTMSFNYKGRTKDGRLTGSAVPQRLYGAFAEDMHKIQQDMCYYDDNTHKLGLQGIHYKNLIIPTVTALQEQKKEIDSLRRQVKELSKQIY